MGWSFKIEDEIAWYLPILFYAEHKFYLSKVAQQVGRLQVHSVHNGCSSHCTQSTVVLILHFVFQTSLSSTLHHGQGSLCSEGKRRDDRHHLLRGLRLRLRLRDRRDQRPRGWAPWLPHPSGQAFIKVDNCITAFN